MRTYPVEERMGLVWVFIGDAEPPPLHEDVPEELLSADAVSGVRVTLRAGNWRLAARMASIPPTQPTCIEMRG